MHVAQDGLGRVEGLDAGLLIHAQDHGLLRRVEVHVAERLGLSRFDLKYSAGTLPHEQIMRSIELYGREVARFVREQRVGAEAMMAVDVARAEMREARLSADGGNRGR